MKSLLATVAVGLGLVLLAWIGSFSNGVPTLTCPMPTVTILPAFVLAWRMLPATYVPFSYWPATLVAPVLFLLWNPGLLHGQLQIPKRSWVLLITLTALSLAYFIASWRLGSEYQGHAYTLAICSINIIWIAVLWAIWVRFSRQSSFRTNLLFHATLFAWLAWYAFPYLGELP